eukprot:5309356-Amphidinium_carterae.1
MKKLSGELKGVEDTSAKSIKWSQHLDLQPKGELDPLSGALCDKISFAKCLTLDSPFGDLLGFLPVIC